MVSRENATPPAPSTVDSESCTYDLDGYVWGVRWQELYPGMRLLQDSAEARKWEGELGDQPATPRLGHDKRAPVAADMVARLAGATGGLKGADGIFFDRVLT